MTQERRILLGRVLGAFGVRGELKLHSFTDPVSTAMKYQPWLLVHRGSERALEKVRGRETNNGMVVTFAGCDDRDAAELMGVPTFQFKLWAFAIGAAVGGLAGAF